MLPTHAIVVDLNAHVPPTNDDLDVLPRNELTLDPCLRTSPDRSQSWRKLHLPVGERLRFSVPRTERILVWKNHQETADGRNGVENFNSKSNMVRPKKRKITKGVLREVYIHIPG